MQNVVAATPAGDEIIIILLEKIATSGEFQSSQLLTSVSVNARQDFSILNP
jgi:hypothetical protein